MLPGLPASSDRSADIARVVEPRREVVEVRTDDEHVVHIVEPVVVRVEAADGGVAPTVLADLTDVADTAPAGGQVLTFDATGAQWAPANPAGTDLSALEQRVTAVEDRPIVDSPDDIGAQPAGDYATSATLAAGLAGKASAVHGHAIGDTAGLQAALDGKQPAGDYATHTELNSGLAARAPMIHTHELGDVNGLAAELAAKADASPRRVDAPVALADAATIATDAALGNTFRVTLAGNRTLAAPTNPADGQRCLWEFTQDATGGRTITLASGAGGFLVGEDGPVVLSTGAGKTDAMGAEYHAGRDRWLVLALARGF